VTDGLDHTISLVVRDARHEAEVQQTQLALRRADEVPGVRIRVEEARVQQLRQVRHHAHIHQLLHVVRRALAQFLAVDPLCHEYLGGPCNT
jgi:hypothetical protein